MQAPWFPIVLIRGFAASKSDIEGAVDQAFLGFEQGSTKTRQDSSGAIRPFFFESVVVRLMKDHKYDPSYRSNLPGYDSDEQVDWKSIWLHRYYDLASSTYDGERLPLEDYALDLRRQILKIRDKVCGTDAAARKAFKVHLVAHSQGGLVARSYLQKICRQKPYLDDPALDLASGSLVASLFTYGTPHNGIEFLGQNVPDLGPVSVLQTRNFNRKVIRGYLGLGAGPKGQPKEARDLDGALEVDRTFCIIGTNWKDYDQPSKHLTGELSDGLVMCSNAYTVDDSGDQRQHSPRAYISRAHGGPLGMVNSEEGYQNLRRFLFGDWRVDVDVRLDAIRVPDNVAGKLRTGQTATTNYVLDVIATVRGQQVRLHERRNETASGVRFPAAYTGSPDNRLIDFIAPEIGPDGQPKGQKEYDPQRTAASLYLMSPLSAETGQGRAMEFALQLSLENPVFEIDRRFWLDEHIQGVSALNELLHFRIEPTTGAVLVRHGGQGQGVATPVDAVTEPGMQAAREGFNGVVRFGPADNASLPSGGARGRVFLKVYKRKILD